MPINVFAKAASTKSPSDRSLYNKRDGLLKFLVFSLLFLTLQAQASPSTVFFDNFESGFPSGQWSAGADETGGSGCRWAVTYSAAASGSHSISPIAADCSTWRNDLTGPMPLNANIWLKYGPFDLTGYSAADVKMRFKAELKGNHRIWIGHNLSNQCYNEASSPLQGQNFYSGSGGQWSELGLDISSRAGASNVCVYVVLSTDGTAQGSEYVFIDDFIITADGGPAPASGAELELHSIEVEPGDYYAGDDIPISYSVTNHGDTASGVWGVEFWAAGRVEYYPFIGDHHLDDSSGASIPAGETKRFQTVVESSNSLVAGRWSTRGYLKYADANPDNNVAVHAFSLKSLGVKGDVVASETAEGTFPSAGWSVEAESNSGCTWGKTSDAGNGSASSLSPVATGCSTPVGAMVGPLPRGTTTMSYGPVDTSGGLNAAMLFRYFAHTTQRLDFSVWTKEADAQGCQGTYEFKSALREFDSGWTNHQFPLPASPNLCVKLDLNTYNDPSGAGDNWFLIDDLQFVTKSHGLRVVTNERIEGTYRRGDWIEMNSTIENFGTEDITDFELTFGLRSFGNDITIGQITGQSLSAGQSQVFTKSFQIPNGATPGNNSPLASLDYKGNWDKKLKFLSGSVRVEQFPDILVTPTTIDFEIRDFDASLKSANDSESRAGVSHETAANEVTEIRKQQVLTAKLLRQKNLTELHNKVQRDGKVRVIAELLEPRISALSFKDKSQRQARKQSIRDAGDAFQQNMRAQGLVFSTQYQYRNIPFITMTVDESALDHLGNSPQIGSITEDRAVPATLESSNAVIRSPEVWAGNYDGSGQAVAVLDTGIDASHSWFNTGGSKIVAEACFSTADNNSQSLCPGDTSPSSGPGTASVCDAPEEACEHGTHVAGIAAGNNGAGPGYGVARGADIIAIQVFSVYGNTQLAKVSDQIAALEHVLDLSESRSIAAINMSLGGGKYQDQASCDLDNAARKAAIDNLRAVGIATVIAAGNEDYRNGIGAPGCISSAISVGATTDFDSVADFSNIYPQIHLLAPGVDITSSVPGNQLDSLNGTSMATPHVAGAFAVLKQVNPNASVDDTLALLQSTGDLVDDLRSGGVEVDMPRINLAQAVLGVADHSNFRINLFNTLNFSTLNVTAIDFEPQVQWLSVDNPMPISLVDKQGLQLKVRIDRDLMPEGRSQIRMLIHSDDPDESIYPGGVYLNLVRKGEQIFTEGFETP